MERFLHEYLQLRDALFRNEKLLKNRTFLCGTLRTLHGNRELGYLCVIPRELFEAVMDIFKRISNVEDFICFIKLTVGSTASEPFTLVEDRVCQFLSNPQDGAKDLQLFKILEQAGEQEKLIF